MEIPDNPAVKPPEMEMHRHSPCTPNSARCEYLPQVTIKDFPTSCIYLTDIAKQMATAA